jgi:presenilin-like A22 family membrane protease
MSDHQTGRAQIGLAYMYGLGFLAVLATLILSPPNVNEFVKSMLLTMLGYLGALVQQQSSYFFARQRPDAPTPPVNSTPPKDSP